MRVVCLSTIEALAPYAGRWDELSSGIPFRSWAWASHWWRQFGTLDPAHRGPRLCVLGVFDDAQTLVGIAPWYLDRSSVQGRVLQFLGSGSVCSEHLTVLCESGRADGVAEALAQWLTAPTLRETSRAGGDRQRWDLLHLSGADRDDVIERLIECLAARGNTVYRREGPSCWQIPLPSSWDEYLAMLSKSHRKQVRRMQRTVLDSGRAVLRSVQCAAELPWAMSLLVQLHQRRRQALGETGCFAVATFTAFHRDVIGPLLENRQVELHCLEWDGRPVAAEYHLLGPETIYVYQGGVDPDALQHKPGALITVALLHRAIERGYRTFDFLRGNEPYKAHWRAQPRASLEVRVVPRHAGARLRHELWLAGRGVKQWIKNGTQAGTALNYDR